MVRRALIVLITLFAQSGFSQDFESDTRELLDVVKQWNFANNAKEEKSLRQLYAISVTIYGQPLPREEFLDLKRSFFSSNATFKQKVISDPSFKRLTDGAIRADFTREVFENGRWHKNPSYLLLVRQNNAYKISGESAMSVQRSVNDRLANTSKPVVDKSPKVQPEAVVSKPQIATDADSTPVVSSLEQESIEVDTPIARDSLFDSTAVSSGSASEDSTLTALTQEVLSDETVAVPKKYVYFLIGSLVVAAFVVLIARRPGRSRKKLSKADVKETQLVRNDSGFEGFVLSLFDPLYFSQKTLTRKHAYAGNMRGSEFAPSLHLEFRNKESFVRMTIEVIFIPQLASREILSYSANNINRYHQFEEETGTEVYIVIGLEGSPNDPKEVFLIPAADLREGVMGYKDLQPYRKYGMFFYNALRRRLL